MPKIISFIGYANSGKTTYLEKMIKLLSDRGVKVALIKHTSHEEAFFLSKDQPKDTDRHFIAGATSVALSGPSGFSINSRRTEMNIEEMVKKFEDHDLIITEGYKQGPYPKVEVRRAEMNYPRIYEDDELMALITDEKITKDKEFSINNPVEFMDYLLENLEK